MSVSIRFHLLACLLMGGLTLSLVLPAYAVVPYTPVPTAGFLPVPAPGVLPPDAVYGKEYSHDIDFSVVGPVADPGQVIAWDGIGGTADSIDFLGGPAGETPEVDAIAQTRDALFDETIRDESHLIFSHDDMVAGYLGFGPGGPVGLTGIVVPSGGPVPISNGNLIGGAGEVSVEESGIFAGPSAQMTWATLPEVNSMPLPVDVDGLEVWGPEPMEIGEPDMPVVGDADKYSLDPDFLTGTSVFNAPGTSYISHATIVAAVESMLGFVPPTAFSFFDGQQGRNTINLDALMVSDIIDEPDVFNEDFGGPTRELLDQNGAPIFPFGPDQEMRGDAIIFSIEQVVDPADPDGYYATGSELFVLDSLGGVSYLFHGGHLWDQGYALAELMIFDEETEVQAVIDINAIEAIGGELIDPDPPFPGDYDDDGVVSAADYAVFRDLVGSGNPLSGNGDEAGSSAGLVDMADYDLWRANFGNSVFPALAPAIASATSVPEPVAASLLLAPAAGMIVARRRRG